uniref:Secreted protein n=2 Tax=Wuchereria bancrofti TaxID=6293 RepID=A0AAF5RTP2_WUCBA
MFPIIFISSILITWLIPVTSKSYHSDSGSAKKKLEQQLLEISTNEQQLSEIIFKDDPIDTGNHIIKNELISVSEIITDDLEDDFFDNDENDEMMSKDNEILYDEIIVDNLADIHDETENDNDSDSETETDNLAE